MYVVHFEKEYTCILHEWCKTSNEIKCKSTIPENENKALVLYFQVFASVW